MLKVKVTRNYQVTIPAEVRNKAGIKEGDLLEVRWEEGKIVMEKAKKERKRLKAGRRLTIEEIDFLIERGMRKRHA